jgi:hypothetical protein
MATTSASSSTRHRIEPGDVVVLPDGREALVTARVEAEPGPLAALLAAAQGARCKYRSARRRIGAANERITCRPGF